MLEQGFPTDVKYSSHSKNSLKTTVKMPSIHSPLLNRFQIQQPVRLRDLSVGPEQKGYTGLLRKKAFKIAEQNVNNQMTRFTKNGSIGKIHNNIVGENDSKLDQSNRFNYSIIEEENRRILHLRPIENLSRKNENNFLLDTKSRGNSNDQSWIFEKAKLAASSRIRKSYLPPISRNTSIMEEGKTSHVANNSIISKHQPSPLQKRVKAERANSEFNAKKILSRKLNDPTSITSTNKASSQSPENYYRLEIFHTVNAEKAERVITKEKKNLLSASFDQETSYEVSQKTDRSVQQENYKKGRHSHRRERSKRNRSQRLKLESLFDKHSNQSLDDAYEKLTQLTNRNSKAREALLKIQESVFELKAEDKYIYPKKLSSNKSKDGLLVS